jgi:hypothetical protein
MEGAEFHIGQAILSYSLGTACKSSEASFYKRLRKPKRKYGTLQARSSRRDRPFLFYGFEGISGCSGTALRSQTSSAAFCCPMVRVSPEKYR